MLLIEIAFVFLNRSAFVILMLSGCKVVTQESLSKSVSLKAVDSIGGVFRKPSEYL